MTGRRRCRGSALIRSISSKPDMPGQPQIEHDAVVARRPAATAARPRRTTTLVVCTSPSPISSVIAWLWTGSSSTTSRLLTRFSTNSLMPSRPLLQALGGDRLLEEAERAVLQAAALLVETGDHVHRDVARRRIVLEPIEQHPAIDVGQPQIERDRIRLDGARELERLRAARRDDALEARLTGPSRAASIANVTSSSITSNTRSPGSRLS